MRVSSKAQHTRATCAATLARIGCAQTGMSWGWERSVQTPGAAGLCWHGWTACSQALLQLLATTVSMLCVCNTGKLV